MTVLNLGDARQVDVVLIMKTLDGKPVAQKRNPGIALPAGRTVTDLPAFKSPRIKPGFYAFDYEVIE